MICSREIKIGEAVVMFLEDRAHYYDSGEGPTRQLANIRSALNRWLVAHVGDRWLYELDGPLFDQLVKTWIDSGQLGRTSLNRYISFTRDFMKFCVRRGLAPADQLTSIMSVERIRLGRRGLVEPEPIRPVSDADYEAVLPHVCGQLRDMLRLLHLTGMRPGEVRLMRTEYLTAGHVDGHPVIYYRPKRHKTWHRRKRRTIPIVGEARELLLRVLDRSEHAPGSAGFVFSKRGDGERPLHRDSIHKAVRAACLQAGVEPWKPMQLRHRFGTEARAKLGQLKRVSGVMGHTKTRTTEIYAEPSDIRAARTMLRLSEN